MAQSRKKDVRWESLALPRNAVLFRKELEAPRAGSAVAVFLDISGYTPFAESIIRAHGERGIGAIVDALEGMFGPAAEIALSHRGNLIAIEGDAMLISFASIPEAIAFCGEAYPLRKKTLKALGSAFPLQIDIGLAEGSLYEFIARDGQRRAYMACGSALREAAKLEKLSKKGSVSSNLMRDLHGKSLDSQMDGARMHEAFLKRRGGILKRLFSKSEAPLPAPEEAHAKSFLATSLRENEQCRLLSPVAIFSDYPFIRMAFAKLRPHDGSAPDPALAHDALTEFFATARGIFEVQAEGFIGKLKDENSMVLIGAPRPCEDARVRAFESVAKMHEAHERLCRKYGFPDIPAVSGMHKGDALCGPILGRYDAIGETLNLASRIKSSVKKSGHGPGRRLIRFSREMMDERVSRMIRGFEIGRERLAGIEETKTLFFDFSTAVGERRQEEFVLRAKELAELCRIARGRRGAAMNIIGDVGSGRDRLLSLVAEELMPNCHEIRCSPLFRKDPYRTLLELMKRVEGCFSDEDLFARFNAKAGFPEMLARFRARLLEEKGAYIINNGDNIDQESAGFLSGMGKEFVESGCRIFFSGSEGLFREGMDMRIGGLAPKEARAFMEMLAKRHHPGLALPEKLAGEAFEKSGGNPLFISELVKAMESDGMGRLCLRRKLPESLRDLMLGNIQQFLSPELYGALEEYSLMHSVAITAPLIDADADTRMALLRDRGFLCADFEFASGMLQSALSESMDPRKKQAVSLALAKAAEEAGMKSSLAIFEYYRNAQRTPENRARALTHAERHVGSVPFYYLVRNEFYDDAIELADLTDDAQRKICGNMLYKKAYLLSMLGNDRKVMERRLELLGEALEYLEGFGDEYKILAQMGAAQCRLGRLELEEGETEGGQRRISEGNSLFRQAREEALRAGKPDAYLSISNIFAGILTIICKEPRAAFSMLDETSEVLKAQPPLPDTSWNRAFLAMLDKMYAEAGKELSMYDFALEKLSSALEKSEAAGYSQGILFCRATEAQVYLRMGELDDAERLARYCLAFMKERGIEDADVREDMESVLADSSKLRSDEQTDVSWPHVR